MRYLVSGSTMKQLDDNTSTYFHVPSVVLMEQAATGFVQELLTLGEFQHILILCGNGNNGADGVAVARLLNQCQIHTVLCPLIKQGGSELYQLQMQIYDTYAYEKAEYLENGVLLQQNGEGSYSFSDFDVVVDAVFGIGLSRPVEGIIKEVLENVNSESVLRVALDMPSGVNADRGEILGTAFGAHVTITFGFAKLGQVLWPGSDYAGDVHVVSMGITEESFLEKAPHYAFLEESDLMRLPLRCAHSNKGTYGKLLVIAGSKEMIGNAALCAKAAYRIGTGLVKIMAPEEYKSTLMTLVPEAILSSQDALCDEEKLRQELSWADAVVIGPGIGVTEKARDLVKYVLKECQVPLLMDADALNIMSGELDLLYQNHTELVMTPHIGEMSRLSGNPIRYIQENLIQVAEEFANSYDVVLALKDFHTICALPYGMTYVNLSGNHGMATAGSGDVLAGVIGGLMAQGMPGKEAAPLGIYVHGLAGDEALLHQSAASLMAGDLVDYLTKIGL